MQRLHLHPTHPQARLINLAVKTIRDGGVIVYPTDSSYALGCHIGDKSALERICRIRNLDDKHNFTLVCRDLSEIAIYAKVKLCLSSRLRIRQMRSSADLSPM